MTGLYIYIYIYIYLHTRLSLSLYIIRVRDTRTGYLIPVRDALWTPARMDVLFPHRRCRRRRRRRRRHSENSD